MIYADYNGSAPLLPSVREYLKKRMDSDLFSNPNAIHSFGKKLTGAIEKCRNSIAHNLGCFPDQVCFNSGASEGISHLFHTLLSEAPNEKKIIITSKIEHSVIPNALHFYKKKYDFQIHYVSIDKNGLVIPESLENLLTKFKDQVALVTIMAANNETGVIQPYGELACICSKYGVEFFSDTTQLIGKSDFHFEDSGLDYAVCSGHKLGALPGSGFIIVKDPVKLLPLIHGSTQERGLRGGTQNYLGIETIALAIEDFKNMKSHLPVLKGAKEVFEATISQKFPDAVIIGREAPRLPGTTLIGYPGIHGQAIQIELESNDIFVTTSSACTDNQPETSNVLRAMGIDDQVGRGVIRISLSYSQGEKEYSRLAHALESAYTKLNKIHSF